MVVSYWSAPFLAGVLVDYWLRGGRYEEREFYDPHHLPWKGVVSMVVGIVASIPFWNNQLVTGPVPKASPGFGDITFIVGFIVTAVLYWALSRLGPQAQRKAEAAYKPPPPSPPPPPTSPIPNAQ